MQFFTSDQCAEWCRRHGYQLPPELERHGPSERFVRHEFTIPADAGQRVALCRLLWSLDDNAQVTDRLLWINEWGVWPSSEHMPLFVRWRAAFGEMRTLAEAPGQLLDQGDHDDGLSVLIMACLFLWDCFIYLEEGVIVALSHDERGVVYEPGNRLVTGRRAALARLGVVIDR